MSNIITDFFSGKPTKEKDVIAPKYNKNITPELARVQYAENEYKQAVKREEEKELNAEHISGLLPKPEIKSIHFYKELIIIIKA